MLPWVCAATTAAALGRAWPERWDRDSAPVTALLASQKDVEKTEKILTWFNISSGETTVEDAVVSTQGDDIYLIIASRTTDKKGIKATWYKLTTGDKDFPDGPAYLFKPIAHHSYPNTKLSVESILKKETAIK